MQRTDDTSAVATEEQPDIHTTKHKRGMQIEQVQVKNFRLLRDVCVALNNNSTVLVGRNNSGKTSLAEVLTRFTSTNEFKLEIADFSSECYKHFLEAYELLIQGEDESARNALPCISLTVNISYDSDLAEYGPLSPFVVDLDPDCSEACIEFTYALRGGRLKDLFDDIPAHDDSSDIDRIEHVIQGISERIPALYERRVRAVDPTDVNNSRDASMQEVEKLLVVDFLKAQRGLDDEKERPNDLIGKIFETLFIAASKSNDGSSHRTTAEELVLAVREIESDLAQKVDAMVSGVIPTLKKFGYPGLGNQEILTKTKLNTEKLLSNYTSVHYQGVAGVSLPESYSGLGSRNLVLILLTLLSYYRDYAIRGDMPGIHLIFIEEPEAHLHPQMQEVFIDQLAILKTLFPGGDGSPFDWPAQFVVSTHSSHVANKAPFEAIRYFKVDGGSDPRSGCHADVLDLSAAKGLNVSFLHKYLTLTRSDLFFADKAILVEGTGERLVVPKMIEKMKDETDAPGLSSQYVTILEVGGAYAHIFFPLLDFLGLPSLVITDLDSIGMKDGYKKRAAVPVHMGDQTSNTTIKKWFNSSVTPTQLVERADTKLDEPNDIINDDRYLAYQVPEIEGGPCGRTFEDAFMLANPGLFEIGAEMSLSVVEDKIAQKVDSLKKSDFALNFAINDTEWNAPRYIDRGLRWLLNFPGGGIEDGQDGDRQSVVAVK